MDMEHGSSSQDMLTNNKRKNGSSHTSTPKRNRSTYSTPSVTTACTSRDNADNEIEDRQDRSRILPSQTRPADLFTVLPPEVITQVLSYLPLRDRKSVRLTCKILDECSKHVSIARYEKFVFPGGRTVSSFRIRKFLLRTKYTTLNLEFHGTERRINNLHHVDVWKMCGDRVRSLYFNSSLETQVLVDIFMNCRNLQVFGCHYLFLGLHLGRALDDLIQLNVVHTELNSLKFYDGSIKSSLLQKIFTVFPNIKHLHATYWDLESKTEYLEPFTQLQSFTYCPGPSERILWLEYVTTEELPIRLKEFRVSLGRSHLKSETAWSTLSRFLASQNQLEKLSLTTPGTDDSGRGKLVMFHALRSCPRLREFQFFSCQDVCLETSDEALEFFALISNLRCLKLLSLPRVPDGLSLPHTNFALKMFVGNRTHRDKRFLFHILMHSPKMQYLNIDVGDLTTKTFKNILKDMSELRTFGLTKGSLIGDEFNNPADDCYIKKLENLEYLELALRHCHALPVRKINFRLMKHVKFVFLHSSLPVHMSIEDQLLELLWNMPTVETVELPNLKLENLHKYVELFQHLKNLRCFVCAEVAESHNLKLLFKACPTLNFVSAGRRVRGRTFSFDSSLERVITEPYLPLAEQSFLDQHTDFLLRLVQPNMKW